MTSLNRDENDDDGVVIHSLAEFHELFGSALNSSLIDELAPDAGLLSDAQFALFKRPRGIWLGNLISNLRYWMWRISR